MSVLTIIFHLLYFNENKIKNDIRHLSKKIHVNGISPNQASYKAPSSANNFLHPKYETPFPIDRVCSYGG